MQAVDKVVQTFRIMRLASSYFRKYPRLLLFPLFSLAAYIVLEILILFFFYLRYGIHFFDPESLELWSFVSLWELGVIFAVFAAPLYCLITFFVKISKGALSHALVAILEGRKVPLIDSFIQSIACWYELFKYAYLRTILIIIGESGIKHFLRKHIQVLGGRDFIFEAKDENWFEKTFLVIPTIVIEHLSLKKAISRSRDLMQATFGEHINSFFSFASIIIVLSFCIGSPLIHIVTKYSNGLIGITLFFLLIGIIFCGIRNLEGIFHAIVYQFCLNKPTGVFSREDILKSFVKEVYDTE